MLKIRRFALRDLERILEIEKESFPKSPWADVAFLEWSVHEPDGFLVAEKSGEIIGYVICARDGYVVSIAVRKTERRKGIGTALCCSAIKRLGLQNQNLTAHCRASNASAIKFFETIGFRVARRIKAYYEDDEDAIEMVRHARVSDSS